MLAGLALVASTACGSTVPLAQQPATGSSLQGPSSAAVPGGPAVVGPGEAVVDAPDGPSTFSGSGPSGPVSSGASPAIGGAAPVASQASGGRPQQAGNRAGSIEIGFVTTSVGNAEAFGANPGNTYTDREMFSALVAEYNATGGLAGRKILPVYGATDTASSNWANDFAAVCSSFTEDHKVRAVIGYVFVFLPSFENCLAKAGVAHLYGGYQPGDVVAQREYPNLVATGHPTVDGATLSALSGALQTGLLTKSTKLGLLIDTCANGERAYQRTVEPWLKARGLNYQTTLMDCARGASDVSGAAAAVSSAELRFASSGVDLVYAAGIALIVFMQQAESQGYHPKYLTTVAGKAIADNAPASQVKNLHGFGWMPAVDVDAAHQPYAPTPAQKACLAKLAKHGLRPAAYNDFMAAYQACDGLELYAKALASVGGTEARAIAKAVVNALPSFRGAGTYDGRQRASSTQRGGPAVMRAYAWNDGCSCLTYRGPTLPIPSP